MTPTSELPPNRLGAPPPASDLGLRLSILSRLPADQIARLPPSLALEASVDLTGHALAELLFSEVAAIETRVNPVWQLRVTGPGPHRPQLYVLPENLRLQAEISQAPDAARPDLRFALGAALALDDLALYAMSLPGVLARDRQALGEVVEAASPVDAEALRAPDRRRFVDYGGALGPAKVDPLALVFRAPEDAGRLLQAGLLSELMLAFVLMHERAHYGLGHLDLIADGGRGTIALVEIARAPSDVLDAVNFVASPPSLPHGTRRVLEFQADTQAFFILCAYALSPSGPCARYERLLVKHGIEAHATTLSAVGFGAGVRLCLTAASLVCLAFQMASPDVREEDPTHPTPQARLMNLMINTPILSPIMRVAEGGGFVLETTDMEDETGTERPDFATLVRDVFAMALSDLQQVATALDPSFSPALPGDDGELAIAEWIADLGAFWISDDEGLNTGP